VNPYLGLDEIFFWSSAVAKKNMFDIERLWDPKFKVEKNQKISTFGSCFAQHIGKALVDKGFNFLVTEAAPSGLTEYNAQKLNYGLFTARTGNIYTISLFQQWINWALSESSPPDEVWEKDNRYIDPFRPTIEPNGFDSVDELYQSREITLEAFKEALVSSNLMVLTLGLTESWINDSDNYEYPICPGTLAGTFEKHHKFLNQDYTFIKKKLTESIQKIRDINPNINFILTVSPIPLTATMSGNHILSATTESKSILRSVAGNISKKFDFVDYFPSYEIINSTPFRGSFFEPNQRNVNIVGVNHVMKIFFDSLSKKKYGAFEINAPFTNAIEHNRVCEEELLNAFSKNK